MILLMVGLAGIIIVLIYDAADTLFGASSSPSKRLMTDEERMAKLVATFGVPILNVERKYYDGKSK